MRLAREISASRPEKIYPPWSIRSHVLPEMSKQHIYQKCRQIVPTPRGSILHPPRASQVPYNSNNICLVDLLMLVILQLLSLLAPFSPLPPI